MDVIDRYFAETQSTPNQLAAAIGLSKSNLYRILKGERDVKIRHAEAIASVTGGAIPAEDFMTACLHRRRSFLAGNVLRLSFRRTGEIAPVSGGSASDPEIQG